MATDDHDASTNDATDADRLRELVEQCLYRLEDEGSTAIDAVCDEHPEHAPALRRRLEHLRQMGMLDDEDGEPESDGPDRLGDFRLIRRIGGGGMGVVHLAVQESLGRSVALKLIRPEHAYFSAARRRFQREVETAARLQHPGIVPVFEFGEIDGVPYFAMEFLHGCSLAEVLEQLKGRAPAELTGEDMLAAVPGADAAPASGDVPELFRGSWVTVCLRIVCRAGDALAHAHSEGVLHRDVKPSNVMVTPDGRVLLIDFGLATRTDGTSTLTRSGTTLGSLPYMSPEQVRGDHDDVGPATDVYSLGVTLYEMLTLHTPFLGRSPLETRTKVLGGSAPPMRDRNPAVPRDAETVCLKALDVTIERRYPSARDMARDLRNVLELRPIEARRASPALRARRWVQRHPAKSLAGVLALLVIVVGPLVLWLQQRAANERVRHANKGLNDALFIAKEEEARANARFAEVIQLSDVKRLRDLRAEADALWPAHPDNAEAMGRWIERAEALVLNRERHAESLARVEEHLAQQAAGRPIEPGVAFGDLDWWAETLRELDVELTALADPEPRDGNLAEMRRRHASAQSLHQRSIDDHEEAWAEAIDAIFFTEDYGELELAPQLGLVPLGPDPETGLWEFCHLDTGTIPARDPATGALAFDADSGVVLVLLPGGTYTMGAQARDPDGPNYDAFAEPKEEPVEVTVGPFFVSKYELTQVQWQRWTGDNPSIHGPRWEDYDARLHPVETIDWTDTAEVLRRMGLRLPTEAQWEYAARGRTDTPWWTGRDTALLARAINIADRDFFEAYTNVQGWNDWQDGHIGHARVNTMQPNPFGLYHVLGNVMEHCEDWYGDYERPARDGDGLRIVPVSERKGTKICRGGCFNHPAVDARVSLRVQAVPGTPNSNLGVRPARGIDPPR